MRLVSVRLPHEICASREGLRASASWVQRKASGASLAWQVKQHFTFPEEAPPAQAAGGSDAAWQEAVLASQRLCLGSSALKEVNAHAGLLDLASRWWTWKISRAKLGSRWSLIRNDSAEVLRIYENLKQKQISKRYQMFIVLLCGL